MWKAVLLLLLALFYVVVPWDLDFVPLFGRIDDLIIFLLALRYFWRQTQFFRGRMPPGGGRGRESGGYEEGSSPGKERGGGDPYEILGVKPADDEETIRKSYRDLLGKYHPDRVHHLGEEFREIASRKTKSINHAWQRIRKERRLT